MSEQDTNQGVLGFFLRFYWMFVGNAALFFSAYAIADRPARFPSFAKADAVFWIVAVSVAAARFVDVSYLGGRTAAGEPASRAILPRYLVVLAVVCLVVWGVAHVIAHVRA